MKAHINHSVPKGSRLLIVNSLILLLVNCFVFVQSDDLLVEPSSWIEVTDKSWPKATDSNEFLVYHSEFTGGALLGLKKKFSDGRKLVTNPELSFKYWATGDGSLRSRKDGSPTTVRRDIKLKNSGKDPTSTEWYSSPDPSILVTSGVRTDLKDISTEDWDNFAFISQDVFTLTLKDVVVKYIESLNLEQADEITGYTDKPEPKNFIDELVKVVKDASIEFKGKSATIDVKKSGIDTTVLKFNLKVADGKEEAVTITATAATTYKVEPKSIENFFKNSKVEGSKITLLNINVDKNGFTLSKLVHTATTAINPETLKLVQPFPKDPKDPKLFVLDATKSTDEVKGYVRLSGPKPPVDKKDKNDICYTIEKIDDTTAHVEVYLALSGNTNAGFKLDTITAGKKEICLYDYVALQNIGNHLISLVVKGEAEDTLKISTKVEYKGTQTKELKLPFDKVVSNTWLYNNPAFDYSIVTADDAKSEFLVCDIVANCYPYEKTEAKKYVIPKKLQSEIAQSPFIRIQTAVTTAHFASENKAKFDEKLKADFNKRVTEDNKNTLKQSTGTAQQLRFEPKFDDSKQATFSIPIELVDLRKYQLVTKIHLVDAKDDKNFDKVKHAKSSIGVVKVGYGKETAEGSYEFVVSQQDLFPDLKIHFQSFSLSTDELFVAEPTLMKHKNSGTITIKLNEDPAVKADERPRVLIEFEIRDTARKILEGHYLASDAFLPEEVGHSPLHMYIPNAKDVIKPGQQSAVLPSKNTRLLVTDWIRSASYGDKSISLNTTLAISSNPLKDLTADNFNVYRVVLGQGYPQLIEIKKRQYKDQVLTITDVENSIDTKGTFRVAYFVHSKEAIEVNVKITKFEAKGVVEAIDSTNCAKEGTIAHRSCQYEQSTCAYDADNSNTGNTCQSKKVNRLVEIKCKMATGCDNIFDRRLPTSKSPAPAETMIRYVPFQIEAKPENVKEGEEKAHYLQVPKPSEFAKDQDFCVTFSYVAKDVPLVVSYQAKENQLIFPTIPRDDKGSSISPQSGEVCASWLTKNVAAVEALYFKFNKMPLYDIDNHYVTIDPDSEPREVDKWTIDEGIYFNKLENIKNIMNQNDDNRWSVVGTNLVYKVPVDKLSSTTPNTQIGNYKTHVNNFRTKWIKVPNKDGHLQFGFKYDAKTSNPLEVVSDITLRVIQSPFKEVWAKDISAVTQNELVVVAETSVDNYYQLEISVAYNLTKIKELTGDPKLTPLELVLENFSVNDPCVIDKTGPETCSNNKNKKDRKSEEKLNESFCERVYANFTSSCICKSNTNGPHCESYDWCKEDEANGWKTCTSKKCDIDKVFDRIKCVCGENQEWNPLTSKCENIKDFLITCSQNQVQVLKGKTGKTECVCKKNFVNITNNCVEFDPCIEDHRKNYKTESGIGIALKTCPKDTKCEKTGTEPDAFNCICTNGFNANDIKKGDSVVCLPTECSACNGKKCEKVANAYKCIDDHCASGYKWEPVKKECIFDEKSTYFPNTFHCAEVELNKDGKPGCKCGDRKFDSVTRGCVANECTPELVEQCKQRGGLCKISGEKAQCECKAEDGFLPYSDNIMNASDWKCTSICSVLETPELQEYKCARSFEHCNSKKYDFALLEPTSLYSTEKLIQNVFVVKNSTLKSKISKKAFCDCDDGFVKPNVDARCEPIEEPRHFINGMEFELRPTNDDEAFVKAVQEAFKGLLAKILEKTDFKNLDAHCSKKDATTVTCDATFQSKKLKDEEIKNMLKTSCVPVSADKCVFLPTKTPNSTGARRRRQSTTPAKGVPDFSILTAKKEDLEKKVKVGVSNFCDDPNVCSKYQYSKCQNSKDKVFQCLCETDKPYFEVSGKDFIGVNNNLEMQICKVKNLCQDAKSVYACADKEATCHFSVELNEAKHEFEPISHCTCPKSNFTLMDHSLSCKYTCDGACAHSKDCARDYLTSKYTCHCSDGWSGDKCDKQVESETTSKAYLISTIVVSIIAVIALIGLAVLYFRRR